MQRYIYFHDHHHFIFIAGECGLPVFADGVVVVDSFTATFEGSSFNFTCADGLSPTTIIRTDCTAEGHWSPDPATYMCINASATTTAADVTTESDATDKEGIATELWITQPITFLFLY